MKHYEPDKKSLATLKILILSVAVLLIVLSRLLIQIYVLMLVVSIIFALTAIIFAFLYLPMYFSHLSYCANENEIKKTSGVFFRTHQSIKFSSIQYSTYVTMPFSRFTGFNFIIFYVYGGRLFMLFLKKKDAEEILENSGCLYCREE
jgi:uncharacterized membrane protein YdbT with pleckstrin-like domain